MNEVVRVTGLAEVQAKFADLETKVARKILRQGLRAGAKVVQTAARAEAPRRTGLMAANIKIRGSRGRNGSVAFRVGGSAKDFKGKAKEQRPFYMDFVEGGHFAGPRKLGDKRKFVPGNHFLTRAYEASREAAVAAVAATWKTLIEEAAKGNSK